MNYNKLVLPVVSLVIVVGLFLYFRNKTVECYEHCDYEGEKFEFKVGEYAFVGANINDRISSVKVPWGFEVELFEHGNFVGESLKLTGNEKCLVDKNFNDRTSSLKVVNKWMI